MKIYLAEWNEKNDASRKWGSKTPDSPPLDDTSLAADVIANYLNELGHEVYPATQRPPQSTKDIELDLFIGVGAGNPLGILGSNKNAEGNLLGVKTAFPIGWIGAQNASGNPYAVRYRTLARWSNSDIEDVSQIQSINGFIPFEEREKRDEAIRNAVDALLQWMQRCENNPETILHLNKTELSKTISSENPKINLPLENKTWWQKHKNDVYGSSSVIGLIFALCIYFTECQPSNIESIDDNKVQVNTVDTTKGSKVDTLEVNKKQTSSYKILANKAEKFFNDSLTITVKTSARVTNPIIELTINEIGVDSTSYHYKKEVGDKIQSKHFDIIFLQTTYTHYSYYRDYLFDIKRKKATNNG